MHGDARLLLQVRGARRTRTLEQALTAPAAAATLRDSVFALLELRLKNDAAFLIRGNHAPQAGACSFDLSEATVAKVLTCEGSIAAANMMCTPAMDMEACTSMTGALRRDWGPPCRARRGCRLRARLLADARSRRQAHLAHVF